MCVCVCVHYADKGKRASCVQRQSSYAQTITDSVYLSMCVRLNICLCGNAYWGMFLKVSMISVTTNLYQVLLLDI